MGLFVHRIVANHSLEQFRKTHQRCSFRPVYRSSAIRQSRNWWEGSWQGGSGVFFLLMKLGFIFHPLKRIFLFGFFFLFCFVCFFFVLFVFAFVFWDRVSLYSPGCPGTHFVDQAGLELRNPPAPASRVLGLKACATTPGLSEEFKVTCKDTRTHTHKITEIDQVKKATFQITSTLRFTENKRQRKSQSNLV